MSVSSGCSYCEEGRNMLGQAEGLACCVGSIRCEWLYRPLIKPMDICRITVEIEGHKAISQPIRFCPMCGREIL